MNTIYLLCNVTMLAYGTFLKCTSMAFKLKATLAGLPHSLTEMERALLLLVFLHSTNMQNVL